MAFRSSPAVRGHAGTGLSFALIAALAVPVLSERVRAGSSPVYYANGEAIQLRPVPDAVTIELSPDADRKAVAVELAMRGMPTMILPTSRFGDVRFRLVPVALAEAEVMNQIRGIPGVRQVRQLYREVATGERIIASTRSSFGSSRT